MSKLSWRTETTVFLGLWIFFMIVGRSSLFRDPGTFWHTEVGRRILSSRQFIETDPFSCTAYGEPWIAGHWLGECAMAVAHHVGGLDTLLLATAVVLAGLYTWVAHRYLLRGSRPALAVLITALTIAASSYHFHVRTHLATIVLLGWTFARLVDFEAGRIPLRSLFWLVPVFALWTNLHAGVIGGIATLAATIAGWWLAGLALGAANRFASRVRPALSATTSGGVDDPLCVNGRFPVLYPRQFILTGILVFACGLAAICHPFGLRIIGTWFGLMASPVLPMLMEEHRPLLESSERTVVLCLAAVYVAALIGTAPSRTRITWLIPMIWLVLTFGRIRHGPLFAVTAAIAIAEMLPSARWRQRLAARRFMLFQMPCEPLPRPLFAWPATLVLSAIIIGVLFCQMAGLQAPIIGTGWVRLNPAYWPIELLRDLRDVEKKSSEGVPVFNEMLFGGFLIYHTPGLRVFIDDRCELYGETRLNDYLQGLVHDPSKIDEWAKVTGFDFALTVTGSRFDQFCSDSPHWAEVRRSEAATLYRRRSQE